LYVKITTSDPFEVRDTRTSQSEPMSMLGPRGNLDDFLSIESRNGELAAKGRLGDANPTGQDQVATVTFEFSTSIDVQYDIQVPTWAPVAAAFALTGDAKPKSGINTRRDFDRDLFPLHGRATARAWFAGLGDDFALSTAGRTSRLNREKALTAPHLANTTTGLTRGFATGFSTCAIASLALAGAFKFDFALDPEYGFFEFNVHVIT
jgi:hypothetical protein